MPCSFFVLRSLLVLLALALLPLVGRRPPSLSRLLSPPFPWTQRLAATTLVCSAVLAMIGYGHLPVTTATAFSFTTPLLVTVLAAILLREQVPALRWFAVGLGFAGVMVIVHPGAGGANSGGHLIGVGAALGSAILYAIQQMLIRRAREAVSTIDVVAQAAMIGVILLVGTMPFVWAVRAGFGTGADRSGDGCADRRPDHDCRRHPDGSDLAIGPLAIWRHDLGHALGSDDVRPYTGRHRPCAGAAMIVAGGLLSQVKLSPRPWAKRMEARQ